MQTSEALEFLSGVVFDSSKPSVWADLGCGDGFFTNILAGMLPTGSRIYALDKQVQRLKKPAGNDNPILFQQADFITDDLHLPVLNGILMANSLHYVANKENFVDKINTFLAPGGMFIIIEYDTQRSNPWVPFPIDFPNLSKLFAGKGYSTIQKVGERKSIYNREKMYACVIKP
jgi:trans-aconitate methyltransferase